MEHEVIFIKQSFYKGKKKNIGDVLTMGHPYIKTYLENKVVKYHYPEFDNNLDNKTYKELQELSKKYNLPAVGKREHLVKALNEYLEA